MRTKLLLLVGIFLLSSSIFSQQLGLINNGNHSIALLKSNDNFACVYSDTDTNILFPKKAFVFPNKETIYSIILDGFKNKKNHQVYVQTNEFTVIRFEYIRIYGEMKVKINHTNLVNSTIGNTMFMTKSQIDILFGENEITKI